MPKTFGILTLFEYVLLIGTRTEQLANGAKPCIEYNEKIDWTPEGIAEEELRQKKIPFVVRRNLPDGSVEKWKVSELKYYGQT